VNATVVCKIGGKLRTRGRPFFNTVLIYEDLNSGKRSWNFYEELTRRFEEDFEFSHLMWSFSMLAEPQTLHLAARSAADASLVILSSTGATQLPARVKNWVECWVRFANSENSALVTLMDHKAKARTVALTHSYLRQVLESRKIDFFPHCTSALPMSHPE
jgi:hypothetical protein